MNLLVVWATKTRLSVNPHGNNLLIVFETSITEEINYEHR